MKYQTSSLVLALAVAASPAAAQMRPQRALEFRPQVGAIVPIGAQRDLVQSGADIGAQTAYELTPTFHVVGSFNWSPGTGKLNVPAKEFDIFQYDAGLEFARVHPLSAGWDFKPFFGLGAGARTYRYEDPSLYDHTAYSAYGAVGAELQHRMVALRLEARDYNYPYKAHEADHTKTRNDIGLVFGVAYHVAR